MRFESLAASPTGLEGTTHPGLALAHAVRVEPQALTRQAIENGLVCKNHIGKHDTEHKACNISTSIRRIAQPKGHIQGQPYREREHRTHIQSRTTSTHSGKRQVNVIGTNRSRSIRMLRLSNMGQSFLKSKWREAAILPTMRTRARLLHSSTERPGKGPETCGFVDADAIATNTQVSKTLNGTYIANRVAQPCYAMILRTQNRSSATSVSKAEHGLPVWANNTRNTSRAFDRPNTQTQTPFFEICKFCGLRIENYSWHWLGRAYQEHLTRKCIFEWTESRRL